MVTNKPMSDKYSLKLFISVFNDNVIYKTVTLYDGKTVLESIS